MMPVPPKYVVSHLWIVISAPNADGEVVCVNVTHDLIRAGRACLLPAGSHRRLPDESYICFPDALITPVKNIQNLVGTIVTLEKPMHHSFVAKIIQAAKDPKNKSLRDECKVMV